MLEAPVRRPSLAVFASTLALGVLGQVGIARAQGAPQVEPGGTPAAASTPAPSTAPAPATGDAAPLSTAGTDLLPPSGAGTGSVVLPAAAADPSTVARVRELETRAALDEARLKTLEDDVGLLRHLKVQGYVQFQYRLQSFNEAASPNRVEGALPPGIGANGVIAKSDGTSTNTNLFRLRRTRLRTIYETDVMRVFLQIDLLPAGGPSAAQGTIARNAEATGIAHWTKDLKTEFTAGLFQIPFRQEILESSMYRPFIERTAASQNFFPTERDLGVHAKTILKKDKLWIDFGVLNGVRLGEDHFVLLPDLNRSKDFYAATQAKIGPVTASLAGYAGTGVVLDSQLLRMKNFGRYGVNVGVTVAHPVFPKLGETKLMAELLLAQNMDTGVNYRFALPAIPAVLTDDVRNLNERGAYVRVEQELTKWGIAGFRFDTYTTDTSIANNGRDTYTFMLGARFSKLLRLVNEASYTIDNIHPLGAAAPSRHIFGYTAWLQGSFY